LKGSTLTIAAAIAVAALGLWLACGGSVVRELVYPLENGRAWVARNPLSRLKGIFHPARTVEENRRLKVENSALHLLEADIVRLRTENIRLRKMLDYREHSSTNRWICAPVLSRNGAGGVRGLIRVGRGSTDGVKVNSAVVVPEGLVGRVEQVSPHSADVRLITSPSVKVSCIVKTDNPDIGTIHGILEGGGAQVIRAEAGASILYSINPLRMRHLKTYALPSHAKIITSGLGGVFPPGLTVGYLIDGCNADENHLEHEGDVEPAVDFASLEDVFIRRED